MVYFNSWRENSDSDFLDEVSELTGCGWLLLELIFMSKFMVVQEMYFELTQNSEFKEMYY